MDKPTKQEQMDRAALLRRISDVYAGAGGREWDSEDAVSAEELSRIVPALEKLLGDQIDGDWAWRTYNLCNFESPETATDFLFGLGIKA
jgi:hypothetical protein